MTTATTTQVYVAKQQVTPAEKRILECAVQVFASVGYTHTTIGVISKHLDISKGVVHYHFASKEILIQETIAYIYNNARSSMSAQIKTQANHWDQIQTFILMSCRYYLTNGISVQALQEIRANFRPKICKSLAQTLYEQELSDIEAILIAGQKDGIFRTFDPAIAALTLRFALNGAATSLYTHQSYDIDRHAHELVETFRHAWCVNDFIHESISDY